MDGGVVGEEAPGPVPVVQVEVHDEDGLREAAPAQAADRDRDVVEDAEPEPGVGHRVVEAAAEVDGDPAGPHREAGRLDGPARHEPLQVERRLRLGRGHLDAEDPGEGIRLLNRLQIVGGVDPQEVLERCRAGLGEQVAAQEPGLLERAEDLLAPQRVHRHAEDAVLVAGVVHDRDPPRPQAVERAAGGPGQRAKRAVAHRRHCTVATRAAWPVASIWPTIPTMSGPLHDLLPPGDSAGSDELLGRFLDYVAGKGLTLYPAQEEAILELFEGKNVILNTPTGSGKSLVASALHFASLAHGRRSVYTCPIKALVNEKWMALCRELGPENVGLSTGDATVNRDAPVLCCTAEILANIALRAGRGRVGRRRGDGRVPLVRRPRPRRRLAGAAPHPARRRASSSCPRPSAT